jgi:haloalkane dehalogenase
VPAISMSTGHDLVDRNAYPFDSHCLGLPAGRLHYVDVGEGPPVVMVHGNPTWSFLYRDLIRRLSAEHRCVAIDHLGLGWSDKPRGWSYLPQDHAANLAVLIDTLQRKDITLVVQDWGGPIGLSHAVAHPENVARVVLMNTRAWPVNRDPYYIAFSDFMGEPIGRTLIRRYNFFAGTMMRRLFGDKTRLTPEAHAQYLRALPTAADREGCVVLPKQIVSATPWLGRLWSRMPALADKPILIVWGMKDIAFREEELRRWETVFSKAHPVRLPTVGHFVQEEAPQELARAVGAFPDGLEVAC